jgi:hypothetical protein
MRVHDVMSAGVVTGEKTDVVRSVVIKMLNRHCRAVPVVEGDNQLIGIVTLRDVLLLYPNYGDYIHDTVHSRDFIEMEEGHAPLRSRVLHGAEEFPPDPSRRERHSPRYGEHRRHQLRTFFERGMPH